MIYAIILTIAFLVYAVLSAMDYIISYIGTQRGVALEGNTLIVWMFSTKPSSTQYILYALLEAFVISLPLLLLFSAVQLGFPVALAAYLVMIVKHYLAYRQWEKYGASL